MVISFLKINAALALLYGFYRLTVSRDTFFSLRRMTLWLIYAVALLVPAFNLEYWVRETPTMMGMANVYADTIYPMVVVRGQAPGITWMDVVMGIYWAGVAWFSLRMLWQVASICRLTFIAKKQGVEGITVHVLKGEGSPFSFFHWIFVYPQTLESGQLHEVLVHECTHARGLHSVDSIFSELFTVLCWFNPFAWLMKQEVRINLEYLADESVLSDGNARKSYQYHLLGLAYRKPVQSSTEIANNFNLLPLKKRIKMMNKRRTSEIGKAKYLLFAPLAGVLLMVSNIESMAREIGEQVPEMTQIQEKVEQTLGSDAVATTPHVGEIVESKKITETLGENAVVADSVKQGDKVYDVVEKMPEFPGGSGEMMHFLMMNVRYPKSPHEAKIQGRVIASFVIGKDGSVSDAKIERSVDPALDAEALRVVGMMPKWTPGMQDGKPVAVRYAVPIAFRLTGDESSAIDKKVASEKDNKQKKVMDGGGFAEIMPLFPGGNKEMIKFFGDNIKYPEAAKKAKIQGRVIVTFTVTKDGNIENAKVVRSVHPALDAEALRVVKLMPKWTPGMQFGKPVDVKYTVPVAFAIPAAKKK